MKLKITDIAHALISPLITEKAIVADLTLGNGFDTFFLAPQVCHIYAFDIQENALTNAKNNNAIYSNITYILDSHENIFSYIEKCDGYIFNLGYLPNGKRSVTTKSDVTINTLKLIMEKLEPDNFILIVVYRGHDGGIEADAVNSYLKTVDKKNLDIIKTDLLFKEKTPPYILLIKKN